MAKCFLPVAFGRDFEGLYCGRQCDDIVKPLSGSGRGQQQRTGDWKTRCGKDNVCKVAGCLVARTEGKKKSHGNARPTLGLSFVGNRVPP